MTRREEPIPALSAGLSYVMMTGLLFVAAQPDRARPLVPVDVASPSAPVAAAPAAPAGTPAPAVASDAPGAPADEAPVATADVWDPQDVVRAKEQCMHLLSAVSAEFETIDPVKKGECGMAAPVRLKSLGSAPKVVFDPPVDVNCAMVAALGKWSKATLQPLARERFKSEVVRIVGSSGYSCRNVYNRPTGRLSQHALGNAIDIGGFQLASGRTVGVLKGWGLTARDLNALAKAKRAQAEADAKAKAQAGKDGKADDTSSERKDVVAASDTPLKPIAKASLTPALRTALANLPKGEGKQAATLADLGKPSQEGKFLRDIHDGACGTFGTVLGPEANDPHRNHFHLDLISRRGSGYCE